MTAHVVAADMAPELGCWDERTRGFWTGGRYVRAGELRPGDVYREGTYSGFIVEEVRPAPPCWADPDVPLVHVMVNGCTAPRVFTPASVLELMSAGAS